MGKCHFGRDPGVYHTEAQRTQRLGEIEIELALVHL